MSESPEERERILRERMKPWEALLARGAITQQQFEAKKTEILGELEGVFCPSCGASNTPSARFCTTCGAELGVPPPIVPPPQPAYQPPVEARPPPLEKGMWKYAAFIIVGLVIGAAAIYGLGPAKEVMVPGPTVTRVETKTATATVTRAGTTTTITTTIARGGFIAPDFTLTDVRGQTLSLSGFKGRVVVLDFMATWCGYCAEENKHLRDISTQYSTNIAIITISVDPKSDTTETLRQYMEKYGITWFVALDTAGVGDDYSVFVLPTLVIVDKYGNIRTRYEGLTTASTLSAEIGLLVKE